PTEILGFSPDPTGTNCRPGTKAGDGFGFFSTILELVASVLLPTLSSWIFILKAKKFFPTLQAITWS
ncbi:unnamed protein product, partial [Dovyalis caffra]